MSFGPLDLNPDILCAATEQGYTGPTSIQQQTIPAVIQEHDLTVSAQTDIGKTTGFTLPLLRCLIDKEPRTESRRPVRALIPTPTRELTAQVGENVRDCGKYLNIRSLMVLGGMSIDPQMMKLRSGVNILVTTPGHLLDLERQNAVSLDSVGVLMLDEANRMLDMGLIHDIRRVLAKLLTHRRDLLFSATFSDKIEGLAGKLLHNPLEVEVTCRSAAFEQITQHAHFVDKNRKHELLPQLASGGNWQQALMLARTKHGANHLTKQLNRDDIRSAAIHGSRSQRAYTRTPTDFKSDDTRVLVVTDIAARGPDTEELPHVMSYELPNISKDYIHRTGRTGRAMAAGEALSPVCTGGHELLHDVERLLKKEIPRITIARREPGPSIKAGPVQSGHQQRDGGRGQDRGCGGQGQGRSGQPRSQNNAPRRQNDRTPGTYTQDDEPPRRCHPRRPASE